MDAFKFAGTFLDGPFNVFLGHVFAFGRLNRGSQSGIGALIAPARACGYCNFLDQLRKNFASFGVGGGLFVFDARPFIVS